MAIKIITDSASDIGALKNELDLTVVPLQILFPERTYYDGELAPDAFYALLKDANPLPTTSQPSPADFLQHFERAKEAGDEVIVITIAENLSGTFQSAAAAKEMACYDKIYLVDSGMASLGESVLVEYAAQLRAQGKSAREMYDILLKQRGRLRLFGLVDTLTYLHKGGRLSTSVMVAGSLLNVKPILSVESGALKPAGKARGFKRGVQAILELIEKTGGADFELPVYFAHSNAPEACEAFMGKLAESDAAFGACSRIVGIGGVIGTHLGPGTVAVAYFAKES